MWKEPVLEGILPQHSLSQSANLKIKIEVDIVPHVAFETEELLRKAFAFNVKVLHPSRFTCGQNARRACS